MNAKLLIPLLGLTALLAFGAYQVKTVKADENNTYPPMVQRLAERFNLNQDEVETVFDEERQGRQQEMKERREERLDQAVSDGVITEEQKTSIVNKWQEIENEREAHRQEMQAWFEEQGIDHDALMQYGGFGPHGGGVGFRGGM